MEKTQEKVIEGSHRAPRVALVAHDAKKGDLLDLLGDFMPTLSRCHLTATHTTGTLIAQRFGLEVRLLKSGPEGGDQQLGALVADGQIDAVIFLKDPLTAQPHEPDISALLRVCDVHNVPLATNIATARAILTYINTIEGSLSLSRLQSLEMAS